MIGGGFFIFVVCLGEICHTFRRIFGLCTPCFHSEPIRRFAHSSLSVVAATLVAVTTVGLAGCDALFVDLGSIALRADAAGGSPPDPDAGLPDGVDGSVPGDSGDSGDPVDSFPSPDSDSAGDDASDTGSADIDTGPSFGCFEAVMCSYIQCDDYEDTRCVQGASRPANSTHRRRATDMVSCLQKGECDYYREWSCVQRECGGTETTCLGPKPKATREFSCSDALNCRRRCGSDFNCLDDCEDLLVSGQERGEYRKLKQCWENNCTPAQTTELPRPCMRQKCRSEFEKCMGCR